VSEGVCDRTSHLINIFSFLPLLKLTNTKDLLQNKALTAQITQIVCACVCLLVEDSPG